MYCILYEGLKIESNEPVYCTLYLVQPFGSEYTIYRYHRYYMVS